MHQNLQPLLIIYGQYVPSKALLPLLRHLGFDACCPYCAFDTSVALFHPSRVCALLLHAQLLVL